MISATPSTALLNKRLTAQVAKLDTQIKGQSRVIEELRQQNAQLVDTNAQLHSAVEHLLKNRGGGAPRIDPGQGVLFGVAGQDALDEADEPEGTAATDVDLSHLTAEDKAVPDGELPNDKPPKKNRKPSKRPIDESNLRVEVTRSELPEDARICPKTGVPLVQIDTKITKGLDYRPGEVVLTEHHQAIYGPTPEVAAERTIEPLHAPAPKVAVEGVTASAAMLAWVLCQKYVLHLPLHRQEDAFARLHVRLARSTLCDWFMKSAFALRPIAEEIERQVRAGPILHLDDTLIKCKVENETSKRLKVKQCYLWAFANPTVSGIVFRFSLGRATHDLASILGADGDQSPIEYFVGDGYATNRSAAREAGFDVRHAGCWAHVLRKFRDAESEAPNMMKLFFEDIDLMYDIEERGRDDGLDPGELTALRREQSLPIVRRLMRRTSGWKKHYSLQGEVAKAMKYVRNQRSALLEFLRDGRVPIDNNVCERAIRPIAIGRRNWLFSGSVEGAEGAAIMYTLIESAKASGVDPLGYLEAVLERQGTWPSRKIEMLTPWAMASELPAFRPRA